MEFCFVSQENNFSISKLFSAAYDNGLQSPINAKTKFINDNSFMIFFYREKEAEQHGDTFFDGYAIHRNRIYTTLEGVNKNILHIKNEMRGSFCIINISDQKVSFFRDPLSQYPIWYYNNLGTIVVSNNIHILSSIVQELTGKTHKPSVFHSASMIIFENGSFGSTPYEGINLLEAFSDLIYNHGDIKVTYNEPWFYRSERSYSDLLDEAAQDIKNNVLTLSNYPDQNYIISDLTGGYDSRLILSSILSNNIQDRFLFETSGRNTGDAIAAKYIRDTFGLRRSIISGLNSNDPIQSISASLWAMYGNTYPAALGRRRPDVSRFNGAFGGLFRQVNSIKSDFLTDMHLKIDFNSKILNKNHKNNVSNLVSNFYERKLELKYSDDDMMQHFFIEHRNMQFQGIALRNYSNVFNSFIPLYSMAGVAAAFKLGPKDRENGRLIYDLMKIMYRELLFENFEGRVWKYWDAEDAHRISRMIPIVSGQETIDNDDIDSYVEFDCLYSSPSYGNSEWFKRQSSAGKSWYWTNLDRALDALKEYMRNDSVKELMHEVFHEELLGKRLPKRPEEIRGNPQARLIWILLKASTWMYGSKYRVRH